MESEYGNLQLWGPNNGSANGLPASSPDGGNFIAADSAFGARTQPIEQTIFGLTNGQLYEVNFYWAGAQQKGFDGATTEGWQVSFGGGPSQTTAILNNPNHGFTGWMHETLTFSANGTSSVLSFLAVGSPDGLPPFSLLDGVSVKAVPEPTALSLMVVGLIGFGAVRLRKRAKAAATAV